MIAPTTTSTISASALCGPMRIGPAPCGQPVANRLAVTSPCCARQRVGEFSPRLHLHRPPIRGFLLASSYLVHSCRPYCSVAAVLAPLSLGSWPLILPTSRLFRPAVHSCFSRRDLCDRSHHDPRDLRFGVVARQSDGLVRGVPLRVELDPSRSRARDASEAHLVTLVMARCCPSGFRAGTAPTSGVSRRRPRCVRCDCRRCCVRPMSRRIRARPRRSRRAPGRRYGCSQTLPSTPSRSRPTAHARLGFLIVAALAGERKLGGNGLAILDRNSNESVTCAVG